MIKNCCNKFTKILLDRSQAQPNSTLKENLFNSVNKLNTVGLTSLDSDIKNYILKVINKVPTLYGNTVRSAKDYLPNEGLYLMSLADAKSYNEWEKHFKNCIKLKIGNCDEISHFVLIYLQNNKKYNDLIDTSSISCAGITNNKDLDKNTADHGMVIFKTKTGDEMVIDPYFQYKVNIPNKQCIFRKEDYLALLPQLPSSFKTFIPQSNYYELIPTKSVLTSTNMEEIYKEIK